MQKIGVLETYFTVCIVFTACWMYQDFLGLWLSSVIGCIAVAVLGVASISEWIEPSRVPRRYFYLMLAIIAGIGTATAVGILL